MYVGIVVSPYSAKGSRFDLYVGHIYLSTSSDPRSRHRFYVMRYFLSHVSGTLTLPRRGNRREKDYWPLEPLTYTDPCQELERNLSRTFRINEWKKEWMSYSMNSLSFTECTWTFPHSETLLSHKVIGGRGTNWNIFFIFWSMLGGEVGNGCGWLMDADYTRLVTIGDNKGRKW